MSSVKSLGIDVTAMIWTFSWATTINDISLSFQMASFILGFIFLSVRFIFYIAKKRKEFPELFKWLKRKK